MQHTHSRSGILTFCSVLLFSMGLVHATPQPHFQRKLSFGRNVEVTEVAFSNDGHMLYVATSRGLLLKETRTGKSLPSLWIPRGWSSLNHVQLSPNGRYLAVTAQRKYEHRLLVWNLKTKRLLKALDIPEAGTMAFSPDCHYLAVSEYDGVQPTVCLLESQRWTIRKHLRCKGEVPVKQLDFSSNSKRLVGTSFYGDAAIGDLEVWDPGAGKLLHYYEEMTEGPFYFLPRGSLLAFGNSLVNVSTGVGGDTGFQNKELETRWVATPYTHRRTHFVVKKWTASYSPNKRKEDLELWDIRHKKRVAQWQVYSNDAQNYLCSGDGRWLVVWPLYGYEEEEAEIRLYKIAL